ncbi:hypothetical protein AC249_AIPGENE10406 [Exaiptasia diaphana]|nr:hypothetical protein AC249_AIPGENE10406 [Exaiptasia diaphana]
MDGSAIQSSPDVVLTELGLKARGDICALRAFCAEKANTADAKEERKRKLLDMIRGGKNSKKPKMQGANSRPSTTTSTKERKRLVYIGWMHSKDCTKTKYTQVRSNKGGGSTKRELYLSSTDTSDDVIAIAITKFFPQGMSIFGSVSMMDFDLINSQGDSVSSIVDENGEVCRFTVERYMEVTSLSRLRLYLASRLKNTNDNQTNNSSDDEELQRPFYFPKPVNPKTKISREDKGKIFRNHLNAEMASKQSKQSNKVELTNLIGSSEERTSLKKQQARDYEESLKQDQLKCKAKEQEKILEKKENERAERIDAIRKLRASRVPPEPLDDSWRVSVVVQHPILGRLSRTIRVRRVEIVKDMIKQFKDSSLMNARITIAMINDSGKEEVGVDDGGVFRDALSAFWTKLFESSSVGEDEKILCLSNDFQNPEWQSVGRILAKGYEQVKFYPHSLCKAVIAATLFGEDAISNGMLLSSFKAFVSPDERQLIASALCEALPSEGDQYEEWLDFLDRYSCKRIPKPNKVDVETVLLGAAHRELLQVSRYVIESFREPCQELLKYDEFGSLDNFIALCDKVKPTTKKVISLFDRCMPVSNAQRDVLGYLKKYIRGLNAEKLEQFLRFCTGASVLCVDRIGVMFTTLQGAARRPIAHTCSPTLELPSTYEIFPQFREEMNNVLASGFWDIDYV